jgi:hypothetical protein
MKRPVDCSIPTDGQTGNMIKSNVSSRNFANVPKNEKNKLKSNRRLRTESSYHRHRA